MSLAALKERIASRVTDNDRIMAILSQLDEKTIPKDPAFIYSAFYLLKKNFAGYFADFIFDTSSIVPHSDELNAVLFRLESSSVLPTNNPSYKAYDLRNKDYMLSSFSKLSLEDRDQAQRIAWKFKEYLEQYKAKCQ